LLATVNNRDVVHLGSRLLPYVSFYGGDPALSASRSPKTSAPIFLLHGPTTRDPGGRVEYLAEIFAGMPGTPAVERLICTPKPIGRCPGDVMSLRGLGRSAAR